MKKLAGLAVFALIVSGCSEASTSQPTPRGLCAVADDMHRGSVLSDDLLALPATAVELENRLRGAISLLNELEPQLESESLQGDAIQFNSVINEAVLALSSFGFEQSALVSAGDSEQQRPLLDIGDEEITAVRRRLTAALEQACDLSFDLPTNAISVLNTPPPAVDPIRLTEVTPEDLSPEELASLLSSGLGSDLEEELLARTGEREMADLLEALREQQLNFGPEEYALITQALRRHEYGDDMALDRLWDACSAGDFEACDLLWYQSARNTEYERYGATCGDRLDNEESAYKCVEVFS